MDESTRSALATALRHQRAALLEEVSETEADLRLIAEDRESELEERGQQERLAQLLARLDDRGLCAIDAIHAALRRMIDGTYGRCTACRGRIPLARLQALPATALCLECARAREAKPVRTPKETAPSRPGRLPPDMSLLSDRELEETLRDLVSQDRRVDTEELRIRCRDGVVHLEGSLPSEGERQILRKLVTDVAGIEDVVDRVQVNEDPLGAPQRSRREPRLGEPRRREPIGTEDVVESEEEGIGFLPPEGPPREEA